MKKTFLLLGAFLLTMSAAFSQAAFFTEDFSGGIPAGWTNSGGWKTSHKSGGALTGGRTLTSVASNTFLIFDSDSLDNGGVRGNYGHGPLPSPQRNFLRTSSINCSAYSRVLLRFTQQALLFKPGSTRIVLSNGSATDTLDINSDYTYYSSFSGTTLEQYDITNIAGGQSNVTLTFLWDNGDYYYWMLDDINLIDAPNNDLQLTKAHSFNYYQYPYSELDSMFYYGTVSNIGKAAQPNTRVAVAISKGNSLVFTDTTARGVTLPSGVDTTLFGDNGLGLPATGASKGTYTSIVTALSDSVNQLPYHYADTTQFVVSDSVYAVENGVYGGPLYTYLPGYLSTSGNTVEYEWADIFYLPNADTVTSVTAFFDQDNTRFTATTGPTVQANIYSIPDFASQINGGSNVFSPVQILKTEIKQLTTASFPNTSSFFSSAINMKVDATSGGTGNGYATILQPGFYGVSIISPSADSLVALANGAKSEGIVGIPGGLFSNGQMTGYIDVRPLVRLNFGHGFNTLFVDFNRTPSANPLHIGQIVTYTGQSNGNASTTTYSWTVEGLTTGYGKTASTKVWKDTLSVIEDSMKVCITATDGNQSATTCKIIRVKDVGVGVDQVTAHMNTSVVPNPTTGVVTIATDGVTGPLAITLTNLLGETVKTFNETANGLFAKSYNLSDLSTGVYIVKIQNGSNSSTQRLSLTK